MPEITEAELKKQIEKQKFFQLISSSWGGKVSAQKICG